MTNKYLLEIGTEELPYKFIPQAISQLQSGFETFFKENNVEYDSIRVMATPRRLAVIAEGLSDTQPDEEKIVKGPIKKVAYDEQGNLTKAGLGFLNKNGLSEKDAYIENDYLHAKIFKKGKKISEILQENAASVVMKLQGAHFMRWAEFDEKFSRPIRWIVSILNDKEIPISLFDIKSSNKTRGHRFSEQNIEINNPDEYEEKLKKAHVIVNQDERKDLIIKLTNDKAAEIGTTPHYSEDLLEEVTFICEYPVPVICDFDAKYLDIPQEVTVTVMAVHQRYFALYKDGKLTNKFITIANYIGNDFSNIKAGNERVIVARLDDAIFFFNEDTKKPFEQYVEALKGVTFQKGLGTVYDKTQRIITLSKLIAQNMNINDTTDIERTALLCKADLTTSLVFEFTELQGFIGADYAEKSGEKDCVVKGIKEHYFPLNAESELAESIEGQIVGIADKLDTVCAVFLGGKIPTGSSDPLGVRRAALGIIKTVISKNLKLNIIDLIEKVFEKFNTDADYTDKMSKVKEFFEQRLSIYMAENYKKDIIDACIKNTCPLNDLCDFAQRVKLITEKYSDENFEKLAASANRISKLLKTDVQQEISESLLQLPAEKALYEAIKKLPKEDCSYSELIEALISINPQIETFFEDVLVMDKDEQIKNNRLSMLAYLQKNYKKLADFSLLQL